MDGSLPSFEDRLAYIRSTHELADQIVELAGHLNAGNYRFLALIAEFDRRKGWNCRATQDCAHWLNIWTPPALQARIRFWNWKTAQIYPAS